MAQEDVSRIAFTNIRRRQLLERLAAVRADITRELRKYDSEQYNELAGTVSDSGDQSVADLLVDIDLAEIDRDVGELRDIEAALLRIAQGSYGTCIDCEAEIPRERLEVTPSAIRCIPCQDHVDRRDREEKHRTL
jgi:RNA polymerase-binding transcription factor DksA